MDPQSRLLDLTDSERAFHKDMHGLSIDKDGSEILSGLTHEESVFYIECLHLRAANSDSIRGRDYDRWVGLDEKHEHARFGMIAADAEAKCAPKSKS
ncbi:hypothetical protein [Xanthobacter flavus]|uniref:hypothetical protein n=1 Tax=Xanthobacter flavus TaxID=281 RepID=UPI003728A819